MPPQMPQAPQAAQAPVAHVAQNEEADAEEHSPAKSASKQTMPQSESFPTLVGSTGVVNAPTSQLPDIAIEKKTETPEGETTFITEEEISNLTEEEKKNYIGEKVYPVAEGLFPEHAPKITGMIIDMPEREIKDTISSLENVVTKIKFAYQLLNKEKKTD